MSPGDLSFRGMARRDGSPTDGCDAATASDPGCQSRDSHTFAKVTGRKRSDLIQLIIRSRRALQALSPVIAAVVVDHCPDFCARSYESFGQVASDETAGAGNQNVLILPEVHLSPSNTTFYENVFDVKTESSQ